MKEKIVIIGANSFQNRLILKAKDMGYETHVFAWECGDVGEKTADYFYPISITEKEQILEKCREINPIAICSIASDLAVLTVNYVARNLGLNANSELCDKIATNKFEMRKAFERAGIYTPKFIKITNFTEIDKVANTDFHFPVIVKPTDRSGSRAITKLNSKDGLEDAILSAIDQSFENAAIVEEFLEGKEYSCECISFHGKHHMLAITEKFTTGAPHFIETGHIEPAPLSADMNEKVQEVVFKALDALDIKNSASHTEFKMDAAGNIGIIEIGARMGGDCIGSDLVYLSTGNDFVKMVIEVASGEEPSVLMTNDTSRIAAIRFIMDESDLTLMDMAKQQFAMEFISDISEDLHHAVVDSSSRYGYFIITGFDYNKIRDGLFLEG